MGNNITFTPETVTVKVSTPGPQGPGGSGGGGTTSWSGLTGVPATFPPAAHAASHASGGSDAVTIAESQVAGLATDLAGKLSATDPSVTNARTPTPHAASHASGGSDAVTIAESQVTGLVPDLAGKLSATDPSVTNARTPTAHAASHASGGSDAVTLAESQITGLVTDLAAKLNATDPSVTNARTPTAHAATHQPGGSDPMAVDAVAGTGSLRTLGTGAQQACAGNDARLLPALTKYGRMFATPSGVILPKPGQMLYREFWFAEFNIGTPAGADYQRFSLNQINGTGTLTWPQGQVWPTAGWMRFGTGGTAGNGSSLTYGGSSTLIVYFLPNLSGGAGWQFDWILRLNTLTNVGCKIGLTVGNQGRDPGNGIGFRFDTNASYGAPDTQWTFWEEKAASTTVLASGITPDTNWHRFTLRCAVAGTVLFSIDGGTEQSLSTQINQPTVPLSPFFSLFTDQNSSATMDLVFHSWLLTGINV